MTCYNHVPCSTCCIIADRFEFEMDIDVDTFVFTAVRMTSRLLNTFGAKTRAKDWHSGSVQSFWAVSICAPPFGKGCCMLKKSLHLFLYTLFLH
jgi:hypothetical protein